MVMVVMVMVVPLVVVVKVVEVEVIYVTFHPLYESYCRVFGPLN